MDEEQVDGLPPEEFVKRYVRICSELEGLLDKAEKVCTAELDKNINEQFELFHYMTMKFETDVELQDALLAQYDVVVEEVEKIDAVDEIVGELADDLYIRSLVICAKYGIADVNGVLIKSEPHDGMYG